jgi:hypothetical protein
MESPAKNIGTETLANKTFSHDTLPQLKKSIFLFIKQSIIKTIPMTNTSKTNTAPLEP